MTTLSKPPTSRSTPRARPTVCLTLPGAGTALNVISGALEVLLDPTTGMEAVAVGGTSGGGLVALALARGLSPQNISEILSELLQRKDLLDKGWPFDSSPGLFKGRKIEAAMRDIFSVPVLNANGFTTGRKDLLMGDLKLPARVCAWDAWTREPVVFCSKAHPDVPVWRAARATMAIEFFFDLSRAREDNARLYGDGGIVVNVPYGLWDDRPEPTVGVRFSHQHTTFHVADLIRNGYGNDTGGAGKTVRPVKTWSQMVPAVVETALSTASAAWPSEKPDFQEVVLESDADGLAFGLAPTEIARRRQHGRLSAQRAVLRF